MSVTDLDNDGLDDIIVAAPFGELGGAISIYNGKRINFKTEPSQIVRRRKGFFYSEIYNKENLRLFQKYFRTSRCAQISLLYYDFYHLHEIIYKHIR